MLDDPDLSGSWKNCNCFHLFDGSFIESNCAPSPISSLSLYFTSLCGCTRLNRIGGKEECGDQANACYYDKRNEGQGVALTLRDEWSGEQRGGKCNDTRGDQTLRRMR